MKRCCLHSTESSSPACHAEGREQAIRGFVLILVISQWMLIHLVDMCTLHEWSAHSDAWNIYWIAGLRKVIHIITFTCNLCSISFRGRNMARIVTCPAIEIWKENKLSIFSCFRRVIFLLDCQLGCLCEKCLSEFGCWCL